MNIVLTDFAAGRHFNNPDFGGTQIPGNPLFFMRALEMAPGKDDTLVDGYAPFCKHLFVENFTEALCGVRKITPENEHLLRTGYHARRDDELPVLTRWFDSGDVKRVFAPYLDIILYSASQLKEEGLDIDGEWGVVSINSALEPVESPMPPITQMRNALGSEQGGSGVPLDSEAYAKSVEYWNTHAIIRGS
jgi:hypothetical protein